MRLLAAFIALACCVLEGFRRRAELKYHAVLLGEISQMLSGFLIEIRCSGLTGIEGGTESVNSFVHK